jgi:segregation and condensation protein B
MSLKAKLEAIIYATEEPVTLNELASLLKDQVLADIRSEEDARLALNETVYDPANAPKDDEQAADAPQPPSADQPATMDASASETSASPDETTAQEPDPKRESREQVKQIKAHLTRVLNELIAEYAAPDRGVEIRQIAGGYRMATKPEHHDVVVSFAKSLKPPVRLSLQALETLSVIAYKQPVTVPEISEIRGVDAAGVIATLLDRKLITTAGRKQVIGRPILYKTTKEFLLRFGLKDIGELPSVEEFEKLGEPQTELFDQPQATAETAEVGEPVTEAVPDPADHLVGDTTVPADGAYATEAEPQESETSEPHAG